MPRKRKKVALTEQQREATVAFVRRLLRGSTPEDREFAVLCPKCNVGVCRRKGCNNCGHVLDYSA